MDGDFPGGAASGSLEQVDAAGQFDDHVVLEVVDAEHFLTCQVIDDGLAHILAALDEDASLGVEHLQRLVGIDAGKARVIDSDNV